MIQFALLFALGFLTAAIFGLLLAPVVHKRIVRFAEDRLKATMPLSPQEVRAQKDAARAGYAAESARTSQMLTRERDKTVSLMLDNEALLREGRRLTGENADLHAQIADMNVEAADMRSSLRQFDASVQRLKEMLASAEKDNDAKVAEIKTLRRQVDLISADIDTMRIDLATRETEAENLKSRLAGLRDERETLRGELKTETDLGREKDARLGREETRIRQLEGRLAREISANADKENFLERRAAEIERLKTKVKDTGAELREASKALRVAGIASLQRKDRKGTPTQTDGAPANVMPSLAALGLPESGGLELPGHTFDLSSLADETRNRATALSERLTNSRSDVHDGALREEIAAVAAAMVAITAKKEGSASPIHALLASAPAIDTEGRKTLASRAKDMLPPE